jgi:serine/threonine protein kinase
MAMNPAHAIDPPGEPLGVRPAHGHALPTGTHLRDYEITGLISEDAFAIVYSAWDHSLQRKVAIKEYLPASMAERVAGTLPVVVRSERRIDVFRAGLKSFVNEARLLARFDHASLVKVYRFWEENGTAYMVMPFYEGPTLEAALAELGHVPGEAELRTWLKPILDAVTLLHDGHQWHQNIGPDGIVLTPIGPVLLGFGAAEHTIAALGHTPESALKPGFAAASSASSRHWRRGRRSKAWAFARTSSAAAPTTASTCSTGGPSSRFALPPLMTQRIPLGGTGGSV